MTTLSRAEALLGFRAPVTNGLAHSVEVGLPMTALTYLAAAVAPGDRDFKFRFVPEETWAAQRRARRLSREQGSRLVRLAKAFSFALEVYGQPEKARQFFFRPHMMLGGRQPIDVVLDNDQGAETVSGLLGRAAYGAAV